MDTDERLRRLRRASRWAEARLIVQACLRSLAAWLPVPLIYALGTLTYIKVAHPDAELERWLMRGALALVLLVLVMTLLPAVRQRARLRGAQALDRHHGLADRVTNALAFSKEKTPTPLMRMAIEDALGFAKNLSPRRAVPLRIPGEFLASLTLAGLLYGISLLEVRTERVVPQVVAQTFVPLEMGTDDVELLREWVQKLEQNTETEQAAAAVRRFNQLVEDIAERRLDKRQIFERLEQLERELASASDAEQAALEEGLQGVARELNKSTTTKPIAEALEEQNLPDAEKAMKELAKRLQNQPKSVNRAELERLRKALDAASKQSAERVARIAEQRRELEESRRRLLKKKESGKKLTPSEQRRERDHERQLKRLDRQKQRAEQASQQMSQLDRELAKAAQELLEEMGDAAKSLESGAEELNRMNKQQLSEKEKEALKKQLEELRQLLRQQKKGGKKRQELLERFRQMARGQSRPGTGKPGEGQQGEQGKQPGSGQGKQPGRGQARLSLGAGQSPGPGVPIPTPGGQNGPSGDQPGDSPGEGGEKWGSGSVQDIQGDPTRLQGQTKDVAAAGIDSGEGEASVEVVYGAAERGFAGRGYRKVFTDYKTVAEEVMAKDEIPPGYKFYVRRYFQLIRPRDAE